MYNLQRIFPEPPARALPENPSPDKSEKISEENSEPATEQEATERLKAEAIKRGYVEGAEVVSLYSLLLETIEGIDYVFGNAGFFAGSTVIMKHGKWARITKPAEQPQEKTFPRMMEVRDDDHEEWRKREIQLIWNDMAWNRVNIDYLLGWKEYREIDNEKADKIEELEENLKYIEDGLNAYLDGIEQIKAEIQKLK